MPRRAGTLNDRQVRALRTPGLHSVGGMVPGLALLITQTPGNEPARSWVLRTMDAGRRRALGLGPYPTVSLAEAREKAEDLWRRLPDPPATPPQSLPQPDSVPADSAGTPTFRQAAEEYIGERRTTWKNQKHAAQWESTLQTYAYPVIGHLPLADVDSAMVLKIVRPIWYEKTEPAKRVRDRIKLVLSWAKAHGMRDGENPAEWRGNLEHVLRHRRRWRACVTSRRCPCMRSARSCTGCGANSQTWRPRLWSS